MTALRSDFDMDLDRVLAMGVDPVVPPDLARHIVVRTTCLPQSKPREDRYPHETPKSAASATIRRFVRSGLPAGAAIAASLLLLVIGQGAADSLAPVPASQADPAELPSTDRAARRAGAVPASPDTPAAAFPQAAPVRSPASAIEAASARSSGEASAASDQDEMPAAPPAQDGVRTDEVVFAYAEAAEAPPTVSGFTLAGNPPEPAPAVYGPVLEPEPRWSHPGLARRSSSYAGLAAAPSTASPPLP